MLPRIRASSPEYCVDRKILPIWLTLLLCSGFLSAQTEAPRVSSLPPSQHRYALLIGISKYKDTSLQLTGPDKDVKLLQQALTSSSQFDNDQVLTLSTSGQDDPIPTTENIFIALSEIKSLITENHDDNAMLLVLFSGHGMTSDGKGYLLPQQIPGSDDDETMRMLSIPVETFARAIARTGAKQTIVLLDACRDKPKTSRGLGGDDLTQEMIDGFTLSKYNPNISASVVLFATKLNHLAFTDPKSDQGFLTEYFVRALDPPSGASVSLQDALDFVQDNVPQAVTRAYPGREQIPWYTFTGFKPSEVILRQAVKIAAAKDNAVSLGRQADGASSSAPPTVAAPDSGPGTSPDINLSGVMNFEQLLASYRSHPGTLLKIGEEAFRRKNYPWAIKLIEAARQSASNGQNPNIWLTDAPFLAASYSLNDPGDPTPYNETLSALLRSLEGPKGAVTSEEQVQAIIKNMRTVAPFLLDESRKDLTIYQDRAGVVLASMRGGSDTYVRTVCQYIDGYAEHGEKAYDKIESCLVPERERLDIKYHQESFDCCGGGGRSTLSVGGIPPAIDFVVTGQGSYYVSDLSEANGRITFHSHCEPPPGLRRVPCFVASAIVAHYLKKPPSGPALPELVVTSEEYKVDIVSGKCSDFGAPAVISTPTKPDSWMVISSRFEVSGSGRSCGNWTKCQQAASTVHEVSFVAQTQGHSEECSLLNNSGGQHTSTGTLFVEWQHSK